MKRRLAIVAWIASLAPMLVQPASAVPFGTLPGSAWQQQMASPEFRSAAGYCRSTGGEVEIRTPEFGTNSSSGQLVLSGTAGFCQYTSKKDGSRVHILLTTLYATMPTLAALAYYAKVPTSKAPCPGGANIASCYCSYLGGSDQFGGTNLAGGGWVLQGAIDEVLEACIFPDLSSIDSWALAYHANNIIRGKNLNLVLRYHKPNS
jgi:putative hemolysin